jgi:hypothetical protein
MKGWAAALAMFFAGAALAQDAGGDRIERAFQEAGLRRSPLFVDVHAPWCHSCYFMQRNVLQGAEWKALQARALTVELDADSPEGARWVQQWNVNGYPSYLIFDEQGREIGRVLGDRPRAEFYAELERLLANPAFEELRRRAATDDAQGTAAARELLNVWYQRTQLQAALDWFSMLDEARQARLRADPQIADRLARMSLLTAAKAGETKDCVKAAREVFQGPLRCDQLWEFQEFQSCVHPLAIAQARKQLTPYLPRLAELQKAVLVESRVACGDDRGLVETAANTYETIGTPDAAKAVLRQGAAYARKRLKSDPASDRNLADNLRYYLERLQDPSALEAWYRQLVKSYPDDYVYAFRFGRELVKQGRAKEALPYLEAAAGKSYGLNRLLVAQQRVKALRQLGRDEDARNVASEALKANGPWFPDAAAELKALL